MELQPMSHVTPIVDSHLDLADNAVLVGRDLTITAVETRALEKRKAKQAMVSLPDLERGGVAVVCATITAGLMSSDKGPRKPEQAEAQALGQIDLYEGWQSDGRVRLIKSAADLDHHLELWQRDRKPGLVILMEGAEPIIEAGDLPKWWNRGVRMIGLTWDDTKYGTGVGGGNEEIKRGGLTLDGFALLDGMGELGFIWDIAHLAEDGVWEGLEAGVARVCASHANARAFSPTDRHLSDDVIRAISERGGMIGIVLSSNFLDPGAKGRPEPVTLAQVRRHAEHMAGIGGWGIVGIGSDLDGGFGLEESPVELESIADLRKIGDVMPPEARDGVLGGNWLRFLRASLPKSA